MIFFDPFFFIGVLLSLTFALLFRASESSVAMFTFHLASCIIPTGGRRPKGGLPDVLCPFPR